jgi:hypothetical protein
MLGERFMGLVSSVDAACKARRWGEVTTLTDDLAGSLPPRLRILARSVSSFAIEGDSYLAGQLWAHLKDAIDADRRWILTHSHSA